MSTSTSYQRKWDPTSRTCFSSHGRPPEAQHPRLAVNLLNPTFCPVSAQFYQIPNDSCEEYWGGLYNLNESTTYDPDDDEALSGPANNPDLFYGADNIEIAGKTLRNITSFIWGVREDGNTSYRGGRARLSYGNQSTIWDGVLGDGQVSSRSAAIFAGTIAAQDSSTLANGQYPGSLIFGGYDRNLISGPVLSAPLQKFDDESTDSYQSPVIFITGIAYTAPESNSPSYVWSNSTGFPAAIDTDPFSNNDVLHLPSSLASSLVANSGARRISATNEDYASSDVFALGSDAVIGDLIVTIRVSTQEDFDRLEYTNNVIYDTDLSALDGQSLSVRELNITIPAANLRLKQFADYSYRTFDTGDPNIFNSPRNYTGWTFAIGDDCSDDCSEACNLGRPFVQSIYEIFEYDLGLWHLAQANFSSALAGNTNVVSLEQESFVRGFYDIDDGSPSPVRSPSTSSAPAPAGPSSSTGAVGRVHGWNATTLIVVVLASVLSVVYLMI